MVYRVYKEKEKGGLYTEHPACIDPPERQKALIDAGYKIRFEGTTAEYEQVQSALISKVRIVLTDKKAAVQKQAEDKTTTKGKKPAQKLQTTSAAKASVEPPPKTPSRQKKVPTKVSDSAALTLEDFVNPAQRTRPPRTRQKP